MFIKLTTKFNSSMFAYRMGLYKIPEKVGVFVAWHLPRFIVYWCAIRLFAHGTAGRWGNTDPGKMDCMEALKRWEQPNNE